MITKEQAAMYEIGRSSLFGSIWRVFLSGRAIAKMFERRYNRYLLFMGGYNKIDDEQA